MLIDSHCHLDRLRLDKYDGNLDRAVNAASDAGVEGILCVGISLDNRETVVGLAEKYSHVVASVGVHPLDIDSGLANVEQLKTWSQHPKVVALGETGLDYYYSDESKQTQQESFALHLQAAAEVELPVIVHTRDAKEDTLNLIKQHGNENSAGVLHCFTEDWDMASLKAWLQTSFGLEWNVSDDEVFNRENLEDRIRELVENAYKTRTEEIGK